MTPDDLAVVAAKNHTHAEHNERAQYRQPMSPAEVLRAAPITYPLTLPMCAPISDGAAAAVVCTDAAFARYGLDRTRAVRVLATVMRTASERAPEDLANHVSGLAARTAYELAGLGPADIDVAEVHDATAMGELVQSEVLGFCGPGEGGALARSGATTLGGRIPDQSVGTRIEGASDRRDRPRPDLRTRVAAAPRKRPAPGRGRPDRAAGERRHLGRGGGCRPYRHLRPGGVEAPELAEWVCGLGSSCASAAEQPGPLADGPWIGASASRPRDDGAVLRPTRHDGSKNSRPGPPHVAALIDR